VVGLVLQAAGQQPLALVRDLGPGGVDALHPGPVRPGAGHEGTGIGQAALVGVLEVAVLALRQQQPGVADHATVPHVIVVGAVEDEDRTVDTDLVRGQPDTVGGVHGGHHVGHQRAQLVVEDGDGRERAMHHRVAPPGDRSHGAAGWELVHDSAG
jgi:hypothetical protein